MDYFFFRAALIGSLLFAIGACKAGDYDLPACQEKEICGNEIDDDCDGIKDNPEICLCKNVGDVQGCPARAGIVTDKMNPASICTEEEQRCLPSLQWSSCKGVDPIIERCANGRDDDCDGAVDEPDCLTCLENEEQSYYDSKLHYGPSSRCKPKLEVCKSGRWEIKTPATGPVTNDTSCDNLDDDCDGQVDEDAVWMSGSKSFAKGANCYDLSKKGVCRTVGTVACLGTSTTCFNTTQNQKTDYQRQQADNVYVDSTTPLAAWDWDCDGTVETAFCSGTSTACSGSNVSGTIYVAIGNADCSIARSITGCNAVLIKPTTGPFIQCGTEVTITQCRPGGLFVCENGSERQGFLYCK